MMIAATFWGVCILGFLKTEMLVHNNKETSVLKV